jgi:hypothetical protein
MSSSSPTSRDSILYSVSSIAAMAATTLSPGSSVTSSRFDSSAFPLSRFFTWASGQSARITSAVVAVANAYMPAPTATPIAATTQSDAAVVSPRTLMPWRMIAPAPRKPIPETTYEATREGSTTTPMSFPSR